MKKLFSIAFLFIAGASLFAAVDYYDTLAPTDRQLLAADWVETGEAFLEIGKDDDAKACFENAIKAYPMGESADSARSYLKSEFSTTVTYDADASYKYFTKRAENREVELEKLNNYLMALEAKTVAETVYLVAELYYEMGDTREASLYLQAAVTEGYTGELSDELSELLN